MMQLKHIWGYGREDIGKKTVSAIIYKYLMERMMPKQHVPTHFCRKGSPQLRALYTSILWALNIKEERKWESTSQENPRSGLANKKTVVMLTKG